MQLFQKKSVPKKLSIKQVWKLHRSLQTGISSAPKQYMIDEIIEIMENISEDNFNDAMGTLYGWGVVEDNPAKLAFMFSAGLKKNRFFEFVDFIRTLKSDTSKR